MHSALKTPRFLKASDDKDELRNEIVWGSQEETFQHAQADVLEIFDWSVKNKNTHMQSDD